MTFNRYRAEKRRAEELLEANNRYLDRARAAEEKIEGLQAELESAVDVAFNRGAHGWVRMNYPDHYERRKKAEPVICCAKHDGDNPPDWAAYIVTFDDGREEYWRFGPGLGTLEGKGRIVLEKRIVRKNSVVKGGEE